MFSQRNFTWTSFVIRFISSPIFLSSLFHLRSFLNEPVWNSSSWLLVILWPASCFFDPLRISGFPAHPLLSRSSASRQIKPEVIVLATDGGFTWDSLETFCWMAKRTATVTEVAIKSEVFLTNWIISNIRKNFVDTNWVTISAMENRRYFKLWQLRRKKRSYSNSLGLFVSF